MKEREGYTKEERNRKREREGEKVIESVGELVREGERE